MNDDLAMPEATWLRIKEIQARFRAERVPVRIDHGMFAGFPGSPDLVQVLARPAVHIGYIEQLTPDFIVIRFAEEIHPDGVVVGSASVHRRSAAISFKEIRSVYPWYFKQDPMPRLGLIVACKLTLAFTESNQAR